MTLGPGRIQQSLMRAFEAQPSAVFCAKQIVEIAFRGLSEPKHRIAALRAARTLAARSNSYEVYLGAPSAGGLLLVNATDTRSLAIGRVFEHFAGTRPVADCIAFLDDPETEAFREARADGFIDLMARRNAFWAEGRDDEADALAARIRERVADAQRTKPDPANPQGTSA